jgi:hypothetical protein
MNVARHYSRGGLLTEAGDTVVPVDDDAGPLEKSGGWTHRELLIS